MEKLKHIISQIREFRDQEGMDVPSADLELLLSLLKEASILLKDKNWLILVRKDYGYLIGNFLVLKRLANSMSEDVESIIDAFSEYKAKTYKKT